MQAQEQEKQVEATPIVTPSIEISETAESAPQLLDPGKMSAIRIYFGNQKGTLVYRYTSPYIKKTSHIFVAATEGHTGAAAYTVHNVDPQNGYVDVRLTVDWSSPIAVYIDYLIINT
jgi:hypothetical protein